MKKKKTISSMSMARDDAEYIIGTWRIGYGMENNFAFAASFFQPIPKFERLSLLTNVHFIRYIH